MAMPTRTGSMEKSRLPTMNLDKIFQLVRHTWFSRTKYILLKVKRLKEIFQNAVFYFWRKVPRLNQPLKLQGGKRVISNKQ
jgi:hypothetical protein